MRRLSVYLDGDDLPRFEVDVAATFWSRARGLLGRRSLAPDSGLLIMPCRQVHTFFMAFPIDAIHVAPDGLIVRHVTLPPNRVGPWVRGSQAVLEVPAGALPLAVGRRLRWVERR